ncbi:MULTISPECIES: retron Ec67 family RNA-directed DNA polymerase/endonuclease [Pantoea]|uniref:retron Ec67 family RNA-directed DNA polymerase/endonuclease n=1 Tax=Pantoea TaxID=53335 RepID=UPI00030BD5B8|nr:MULTISPECIES: retron Ec67 family RNA-directed DNA polymerase/endonuclease [Pantoea]MCS3401531.1 retron Ec67 family RNA-directed DNA polymerase/endonuclease [Pantoea sp. B566]MDQ1225564.1 RNA-directed DNA polymerase [Pantoea ananatis]MDR6088862.1 RNA-directed DNA polymerase [Pantoea ananatis]
MTTQLARLKLCFSKPDFARLLELDPVFLTRVVYMRDTEKLYTDFTILKKNKTQRVISAPDEELKEIQRKISDLLLDCLTTIRNENKSNNKLSHGFELGKNIITNAERHKSKKWVLNIDLSNFFDQFNYGRVSGYFIKNKFFELHSNIANLIAKIACYKNKLPQGSPCSPVISNLILQSLDQRLNNICKKNGCTYSRYADDITISTNKKKFPKAIVSNHSDKEINLNNGFIKEILRAGFSINNDKTRLRFNTLRQEVTGLTVNSKISVDDKYSRRVRSMVHKLFLSGEYTLIDKKTREPRFGTINEIQGMLGFVDSIDKYNNNLPNNSKHTPNKRERLLADFIYFTRFHFNTKPTIITEGKTDITYLRVALNALCKKYPSLIEKKKSYKGEINDYKFSFFIKNAKTKFLLKLEDGSSHIKNFIKDYDRNIEKYKADGGVNPVIIILDNDSGSTGSGGIFSLLLSNVFPNIKLSREDIRKVDWLWVTKNLYVIFTPLKDGQDSSLEDLFDTKTLATTLNGKVFNNTNKDCKPNEYGKEYFAKHVVLKNKDTIDFKNFIKIFDSIEEIIKHHSKK